MDQPPPNSPPENIEPEPLYEEDEVFAVWYEQLWEWARTSGVLVYVVIILLLILSLLAGFFVLPLLDQLRQVGQ